MPRVHLIGGPGSGKTYAAGVLSARLRVAAHDLDDLFWDNSTGYGVRARPAVRDQELASIVANDGWIIEGVFYGWLAPAFAAADTIVVLTPSIMVRHWRVMKRYALRKARRLPPKERSLVDLWRLLRWSHTYDREHLAQARRAIAALGRTCVECQSLDDVVAATCYLEPHT